MNIPTQIAHIIKASLDNYYPGRTSFKVRDEKFNFLSEALNLEHSNYHKREATYRDVEGRKRYSYVFQIHFPELNITNENEDSHTLYDYVFKARFLLMSLPQSGKWVLQAESIHGTAFSMNYLNALNPNYIHSHQNHYPRSEFGGFCTGQGAFIQYRKQLSDVIDRLAGKKDFYEEFQLAFEAYLGQIQCFLEWESLAGGPFLRIFDHIYSSPDSQNKIANIYKKIVKEALDEGAEKAVSIDHNGDKIKISFTDDFKEHTLKLGVYRIHGTSHQTAAVSEEKARDYFDKKVQKAAKEMGGLYNVGKTHIKSRLVEIDQEKYKLVKVPVKDFTANLEKIINTAYENRIFEFVNLEEAQIPSFEPKESSILGNFGRA